MKASQPIYSLYFGRHITWRGAPTFTVLEYCMYCVTVCAELECTNTAKFVANSLYTVLEHCT